MQYLQDIDNILANSRRRKSHRCYHQSHSCRCHQCCCHCHHHHRYIITSIDGTINTRQANNHAIKDIATSWKCKSPFFLGQVFNTTCNCDSWRPMDSSEIWPTKEFYWILLRKLSFKQMPFKVFIAKCGCLNILSFTVKEALNGGINRETHSKVSRHKIL